MATNIEHSQRYYPRDAGVLFLSVFTSLSFSCFIIQWNGAWTFGRLDVDMS
ncbi:hypothetical protein HOP38_07680 [Vibrio mediterranei]|uniref:hypothetical protein n=1 Tax=Vibrio mediterranei TaxID=689 RepID=UPI00180079A4|nr:hypothetical protein [Vibrio mediterranei]NUW72394.1 hypothetical protein [Vibrio mediterranei]